MKPTRIFLDANAGIAARPEVLETLLRVEREAPGNPSATNRRGRHAQAILEEARNDIAARLGCEARQVVFTSGATEANNLALVGIALARRQIHGEWPQLLLSKAEHPSALAPLRRLQQEGASLHFLPLDAHAKVDLGALPTDVPPPAGRLLSLQWANNETGAVQDLAAAAAWCNADQDWHADAVQGLGKLPWDSRLLAASSFTLSGHKIGAPKGIGVLVLREDILFTATMVGGGQQRQRRGGTEAPALAAAFAHALALAMDEVEARIREDHACREIFLSQLKQSGIPFRENHPAHGGLSNTLNLSFPDIDGRLLLPTLDAEGLDLASGSACSSGSAQASTVLLACGLPQSLALASLRLSFPTHLTPQEAAAAASRLIQGLQRIYKVGKP